MNSINTTISTNNVRKLNQPGVGYWVYSLTGGATPSVEVKTDRTPKIPHKAKTGVKLTSRFENLEVYNTTGTDIDAVIVVYDENEEYKDNS